MIQGTLSARRIGPVLSASPGGAAAFVGAYDAIPSIVAAYGFRLLLSSYFGNPILRLRRSSDNAQQDIGHVANGDLDTAAAATFIGGGSGYIVNWYEQKNGYTAAQATPARQPLYVASGQNGHPVGRWDGNDDYLSLSTVIPAAVRTAVSTYKKATGAVFTAISGDEAFSSYSAYDYNDGNWYLADEFGYWSAANDGTISWRIVSDTVSGALAYLYKNSVNIPLSSKTLDGRTPNFIQMGKRGLNHNAADVAELVICNAALSTADRQAAEAASNAYWSIY